MKNADRQALAHRFEKLVERVFIRHELPVTVAAATADRRAADLLLTNGRGDEAPVEVKLYYSLRTAPSNLFTAVQRLEAVRRSFRAPVGVLVANSRIDDAARARLSDYENILVFDFDELWSLCEVDPRLVTELDQITREALVFRGGDLPEPQARSVEGTLATLRNLLGQPPATGGGPTPSAAAPGADLCASLKAVPSAVAKPFEEACEKAVRYLFQDELVRWDQQHSSHGGMHRFDLIGRVASKEDFWQTLISDFRARYLIFEFKNYSKKITQREIYTTEKYLYPAATRGAALIISTLGADTGAENAMRGALRETGKLIMSLSVEELCEMLHAKDAGSDHLGILVEKLDGMLMGLER